MSNLERALSKAPAPAVRAAAGRAAARVVSGAREAGLIDVGYSIVDTPFGPMLVAVTPRGLVRVEFHLESIDEAVEQLAVRLSPRVLESAASTDEVRRELDQYFTGRRRSFDVPLDWSLSHGFAERVLRATYRIPYGHTSTYMEMAAKAGNRRASRAAGSALGGNPIPIVVPCHRVLRTGGNLGGYGGGLPMKESLLKLEGAIFG